MEWISVKDKLPEAWQTVLCYSEEGVYQAKYEMSYGSDEMEFDPLTLGIHGCGCCGYRGPAPTHWMPLPEAPEVSHEG